MHTRWKILIVDDEPFNVDFLEQELEDLGYDTASAEDGQEALAKVTAAAPDLVLLDIMMPIMDGFEVLTRLKADTATRNIPVIIISAMDGVESVVRGIEMGAEDYLPKPFDPVLLQARISSSLEKKRLRDQEQLYLKGLERELEIGREIQAGFLPEQLPQLPGWEIAAHFAAARTVGGDFYDAFTLASSDRVGLLLGDVSDKGVGAALYMTLFRSLLRATAEADYYARGLSGSGLASTPGATWTDAERLKNSLGLTNNYIAHMHGQTGMFASIFLGLLHPDSGSLLYVNAGHEPPLILNANGVQARLTRTGPVVGVIPHVAFDVCETQLAPGDALFVFSDGVIDAQDERGEFLSREKLLSLLARPPQTVDALLDSIADTLEEHMVGTSQYDDITMLAMRRKPKI
jgi:serine phosphatase RsbU (regulator of sigma subunit)